MTTTTRRRSRGRGGSSSIRENGTESGGGAVRVVCLGINIKAMVSLISHGRVGRACLWLCASMTDLSSRVAGGLGTGRLMMLLRVVGEL